MNKLKSSINNKTYEQIVDSVIKKYGRQVKVKYYSEFDELTDLEILSNAMSKGYKKLLYVIRPAGTNLLAFEKFIAEWYITARGDYKNFTYILIDLFEGVGDVITYQKAFELISKRIEPPYPLSQNSNDYLDWIKDDLRYRGFSNNIDTKSFKQIMEDAHIENSPVLIHYLEKVQNNIKSISNAAI